MQAYLRWGLLQKQPGISISRSLLGLESKPLTCFKKKKKKKQTKASPKMYTDSTGEVEGWGQCISYILLLPWEAPSFQVCTAQAPDLGTW